MGHQGIHRDSLFNSGRRLRDGIRAIHDEPFTIERSQHTVLRQPGELRERCRRSGGPMALRPRLTTGLARLEDVSEGRMNSHPHNRTLALRLNAVLFRCLVSSDVCCMVETSIGLNDGPDSQTALFRQIVGRRRILGQDATPEGAPAQPGDGFDRVFRRSRSTPDAGPHLRARGRARHGRPKPQACPNKTRGSSHSKPGR